MKRAKREFVNFSYIEENTKVKSLFKNNPNHRPIYHIHIRKTGGKSINFSFLSHSNAKDLNDFYKALAQKPNSRIIANGNVFVGWNLALINKGNYSFAFSHAPLHKLRLPENAIVFTCFRDPVKRVISHYNMLKYFQRYNIHHSCMNKEGKWLGDSFDDFLKNIPKETLCNQLYMFSKHFDIAEAYENIMKCDYYMFTEEMTEGLKDLEEITGWTLPLYHQNKYQHRESISQRQIDLLKDKLTDEYDFIDRLKKQNKNEGISSR